MRCRLQIAGPCNEDPIHPRLVRPHHHCQRGLSVGVGKAWCLGDALRAVRSAGSRRDRHRGCCFGSPSASPVYLGTESEPWKRGHSARRVPCSQVTSEFRRIEIVVAAAERILSLDKNSSIVFLSPTVDDRQVARISELTELKWLVLDHTEVTDEGLLLLSSLKKLRRLYVRCTRVTPDGIQRLQQVLPDVRIIC